MRTLVLGGYGAVGARIVAQLRADGEVAFTAGRDPARADRVVNLDLREAGAGSLRSALSDVDVVVNGAGVENPALAALIADHGVALVDITARPATWPRWSGSTCPSRCCSAWGWPQG